MTLFRALSAYLAVFFIVFCCQVFHALYRYREYSQDAVGGDLIISGGAALLVLWIAPMLFARQPDW